MKKYIDKDSIKKRLFSYYGQINEQTCKELYDGSLYMAYEIADMINDCIDNEPIADVAPIKHGKWLECAEKRPFGKRWIECSECKSINGSDIKFSYCFNCGAKMDLK